MDQKRIVSLDVLEQLGFFLDGILLPALKIFAALLHFGRLCRHIGTGVFHSVCAVDRAADLCSFHAVSPGAALLCSIP